MIKQLFRFIQGKDQKSIYVAQKVKKNVNYYDPIIIYIDLELLYNCMLVSVSLMISVYHSYSLITDIIKTSFYICSPSLALANLVSD